MATAQSINSTHQLCLTYYDKSANQAKLNFRSTLLNLTNGELHSTQGGILDAFATSAESQPLLSRCSPADQIKCILKSALGRSISHINEGFLSFAAKLVKGTTLQNVTLDMLEDTKIQDVTFLQNKEKTALKNAESTIKAMAQYQNIASTPITLAFEEIGITNVYASSFTQVMTNNIQQLVNSDPENYFIEINNVMASKSSPTAYFNFTDPLSVILNHHRKIDHSFL
jgi:hypothetical protein